MYRKKRSTALFLGVLAACTLPDLTAPVKSTAAIHQTAAANQSEIPDNGSSVPSPHIQSNEVPAGSPVNGNTETPQSSDASADSPANGNPSDPLAGDLPADTPDNGFNGNTLELSAPPSAETTYSDSNGGTVTVSPDGSIRMDNAGSQSLVNIILLGGDSWTLTEQTGTNNIKVTLATDTKLKIPDGKSIALLDVLSKDDSSRPELVNEGTLILPSDADCLQSEKISITGAGVLNLETKTDTTISGLSAEKLSNPNIARKFVFTGTGHLTITGDIQTGVDGSSVTIEDGADVTINGGLGIGSSACTNGTLLVTGTLTLTSSSGALIDHLQLTNGGKLISGMPLGLYAPPEIDEQSELQVNGRPLLYLTTITGSDSLTLEQKEDFISKMSSLLPESYTIDYWSDSASNMKYFTILDRATMQPPENGLVLSHAKVDISSNPEIQVTLTQTDFEYDGTAKTPAAVVTRDGQALTEGTDYTISYTSHTNAGEAAAVITGIGDYCGERIVTFRIHPAIPVLSFGQHHTQTSVYNGRPAAINYPPAVTLAGGETFSGEIQYSYTSVGQDSYVSGLPSEAGTYQIRASIPASGNYTGAVSEDFLTLTIKSASSGNSSGGYYPSAGSYGNHVIVNPEKKEKIYRTETIHHPDGSVTTIVTEQDDSSLRITETKTEVISPTAIRYTQTIITSPPREIVKTQVTTEWMPDGTCVSTKIHTDKTGAETATVTTTKPDGSKIKETTTNSSNSLGRDVRLTVRSEFRADGTISAITETSVINGAERSQITVTVQKDSSGNVKSQTASIRKYRNGNERISLDKTDFQEIKEAAGEADTAVTISVREQDGREAFTIRTTTRVMDAEGTPQLFQLHPSTGERILVPYVLSVDKAGNMELGPEPIADGTYEMLSEQEGRQTGEAIMKQVVPRNIRLTIPLSTRPKTKITVEDTSSSQIRFKKAQNIESAEYYTNGRIITVSKDGKITPLKPGTAKINVTLTLKNNNVKKENITVRVTKKKTADKKAADKKAADKKTLKK